MSADAPIPPRTPETVEPDPGRRSVLTEWFATRIGGILVPIAATVLAFFVGGIVVLATGHNPLSAYKAIFDGTGLNWFLPWVTGDERREAAGDLQQTLIITTPLMLTALAVAFAFRCGMFNIGGQGQYLLGVYASLYIGTHFIDSASVLHITFAIVAAILAGAVWGGIAGFLKATVGAHEVISTIMLNWIAVFGGQWLFELNGPLQGSEPDVPRSADIAASAQLPGIWGGLQPLHAGIFIALFSLVVYHLLLNRTTLGYEVRAVGFNPEAARYGGIPVARNYFLALAISGGFAGLAGAMDLLGWKFHVATNDIQISAVGFIGIAVALLGRNKAIGILFAALLFGALQVGTSARQLDPAVFPPELAGNLSTMIQALIILFVGAELLIVYIWQARRRVGFGGAGPTRVQAELRQ
ncbi:MAG TPA: ABC transporter permease [Gaiellaceae bacterium]